MLLWPDKYISALFLYAREESRQINIEILTGLDAFASPVIAGVSGVSAASAAAFEFCQHLLQTSHSTLVPSFERLENDVDLLLL